MRKRCLGLALIFFLALLFFIGYAPRAWTQTDSFYKGKSLHIVVGSTAGGFYDRWGRLFAKYMGKYIPGNPEIIVQNMPGAGSVIAVNNVYNVARPDGLTVVMPINGVYLDQLTGRPEAKFDMRKFHWIGSPAVESVIMYMRADAPYKSIEDLRNAKQPPKCGSTGTGSTGTPARRSTPAVPLVARSPKPRSASRFAGNTIARLSRFATLTNTVPAVGSACPAATIAFAKCAMIIRVTRAATREAPGLAGHEIVWIDNALDAFMLEVQGSGRVQLTTGETIRLQYADQNGQPYRSIGRYLAVALNREKTDRELRAAQKKLNEHAIELEQKVADRTASLKQIIGELQTFSYTLAHDLRAPIRALKGYCEVLVEDYSDQLREGAAVLRGAQRCLLDLVPAFLARGWEVSAAVPEGPMLESVRSLGATARPIRCGPFTSERKSAGGSDAPTPVPSATGPSARRGRPRSPPRRRGRTR